MPKVAVIGAGIAGLRASDILSRSGVPVTLFEARNRIGGRVHQQLSGGHLVDMGANWIHGTNGNPMMKLAERTKTAILEPEEAGALFDAEGVRRPDAEAARLSAEVWGIIVDAFKYSDEHSASIEPHLSLYDYFQSKLSTSGRSEQEIKDILNESHMWGPFVGDHIQQQSLKFFFLEECIDAENVFVASTYKSILDSIAAPVLAHADVDLRLNTEITHFTLHDDGGQGGVTITTAGGSSLTFDDVIVTCPLGWLKHNHATAFTPPLPPRLQSAISAISFGRLEKLYITFPSAWWASCTGTSDSLPIFTHFHTPSYLALADPTSYNQSLVSLAHLPSPHAHPTLLFYMYGACASQLVLTVSQLPPHSPEYNAALLSFALPFLQRLPGFDAAQPACTPTSLLLTTWQADRFAGHGSYANFQTGLTHGDDDIRVLRDAGGLGARGLWLAGEHTAPFVALGTTTGAWWSGEGVGRRVCARWGVDVVSADEDQEPKKEKEQEQEQEEART